MPKIIEKSGELGDSYKLIALRYLQNGRNQYEAWKFYHPKSTEKSCRNQSSDFFNKPQVKVFISSVVKKAIRKYEITNERIMQEFAVMAFSEFSGPVSADQKREALIQLAKIKKMFDPELPPPSEDGEENAQPAIQIILPDNRRCDYIIKT